MDNKKVFNETQYKRDFNAANYDRIDLSLPKGKKQVLKNIAAENHESVNNLINRAIDVEIEKYKKI